jgi:tripartite-type tricarboxylate transporter receptor subunit TctC
MDDQEPRTAMQRRTLLRALALGPMAAPALAQIAGGRAIRIIVPLTPGSPTDAVARLVAQKLGPLLNQTFIVENKPGANGVIAVQELMRSPADGSTLFFGSVSIFAINVPLVRNLPYDPRRDFTPISTVYSNNHAWVANPAVPVRTMAELVAHARSHPGKLNVGIGSTLVQVQVAWFEKMAGVEFLKVPYSSVSTNITDLLSGTLDLMLLDMGTSITYAKEGRIRVLGTSPLKRNPLTPDWPAVSETLPGYDVNSWAALVGPPGLPRELAMRLSEAIARILQQADVIESLAKTGGVPMPMTPDALKGFINSEVNKFVSIARDAKLEPL